MMPLPSRDNCYHWKMGTCIDELLRIFLKKGLVAEKMTLCAIRGCSSFKTRVTSVKAAVTPKSCREAHCVNMLLLQPWVLAPIPKKVSLTRLLGVTLMSRVLGKGL